MNISYYMSNYQPLHHLVHSENMQVKAIYLNCIFSTISCIILLIIACILVPISKDATILIQDASVTLQDFSIMIPKINNLIPESAKYHAHFRAYDSRNQPRYVYITTIMCTRPRLSYVMYVIYTVH